MKLRIRALLGAALLCAACTFDLEVPAPPQRGGVRGTVDTQGKLALADNEVQLISASGGRRSAITGAAGAFVFDDVLPGVYFVQVSLPTFAPLLMPAVEVKPGMTTDLGTLTPTYLGGTTLEGYVTGKVVVQGGGEPTGGQVEFLLEQGSQKIAAPTISAAGTFDQRIPPGTYLLRATHPWYVSSPPVRVVVGQGETKDLTATPLSMDVNPATVSGVVLEEVDGNPPVAAAGALVSFDTGATAQVDSTGHFQVTGLPAGRRTYRVTLAGFHDVTEERTVTLAPGDTKTLGDIELRLDRGSIKGVVVMADGQPIRDVQVSVEGIPYSGGVSPQAADPSRGDFLITNVPVGVYAVAATRARYSRALSPPLTVAANQTVSAGTLTLTLLLGDFAIDDGDPNNLPGYSRGTSVTLNFSGFTNAAEVRYAQGDPTLAGAAWEPFAPSKPLALTGADGTKTVYAQYRDASMQPSAIFSASIILDQAPPTRPLVVIAGGVAFTRENAVLPLTLTADEVPGAGVDAVSGLAFVRISGTSTVDANGDLTVPREVYRRDASFIRPAPQADGVQPLYVQFYDAAGNRVAAAPASITIDTVPPSGSLVIAQGPRATAPGYTHTTVASLDLSTAAEPNQGFVQVRLSHSLLTVTSAPLQSAQPVIGWLLDPVGQGTKTVAWQLVDAAGNAAAPQTSTIVYDTTPPSGSATLVGSTPTRNTTVTLQLTALDSNGLSPAEAVTVSADPFFTAAGTTTPSPFPSNSQVTFPLASPDGLKQVYVRIRDIAGNDLVTSVQVELDTTPPVGSISLEGQLADGTASSSLTVSSTVSVNLTQSGATHYYLMDGALASCPDPATGLYTAITGTRVQNYVLPGSGATRAVRACFADAAGNSFLTPPVTIGVDSTGPAGCTLALAGKKVDGSAPPAGKTARRDITAQVPVASCSEQPAELFLTVGTVSCAAGASLAWVPYNASTTLILGGADGTYTVNGCVRDAARNTTALPAANLQLDTTPPLGVSVVLDGGAEFVNAQQVAARGGYKADATGTSSDAVAWAAAASSTPGNFVPYSAGSPTIPNVTFAGFGVRTVYAVFEDDVGNRSPPVTDTINFDDTPPAISDMTTFLQLSFTKVSGYTNTPDLAVTVKTPLFPAPPATPDPIFVKLAQAAGAACATTDFESAEVRQLTEVDLVNRWWVGRFSFTLTGGDGSKRVCAQFQDAAGNPSSVLVSTPITLDTVPPSAVHVTTRAATLPLADNQIYAVTIAAPAVETNFFSYEILGGKDTSWRPVWGQSTTSFSFIIENRGDATGTLNNLRIRGVDNAGNIGPSDAVAIVADTVAPSTPPTAPEWVDNHDGTSRLFWQAPAAPHTDVVGYELAYGSTSSSLTGSYAAEGVSPLQLGPVTTFALSGLNNGSPTYVTLRAVDQAGNKSPASPVLMLQPNEVSPNLVKRLPLPAGTVRVGRLAASGNYLYVAAVENATTCAPTRLHAIDLRSLVSPVQGGRIQTSPAGPTVVWSSSAFSDLTACLNGLVPLDVVVDGNYLFLGSGPRVRIFDLSVPSAPVLVSTIDTGTGLARSLSVIGQRLVVSGGTYVGVFSTAKLYDGDPASVPTVADLVGSASNGHSSASIGAQTTRNRLLELPTGNTTYQGHNLADALDSSAATLFDNNDRLYAAVFSGSLPAESRPPISGNYLYGVCATYGFSVGDITNLWTGALLPVSPAYASAYTATGQFEVAGNQAYTVAGTTMRVLELTDLSNIREACTYDVGATATGVTVWGNYAVVATMPASGPAELSFLELATPRSMSVRRTGLGAGLDVQVAGGFVYTSEGVTFDTQAPLGPSWSGTLSYAPSKCGTGSAWLDDTEVMASGTKLSVAHLDLALDRNVATAPAMGTDSYDVTLAAGVRATDVKPWGNYLVVAEVRADGVWLEVFDATKVRDRDPATTLSVADSKGSYQVVSMVPPTALLVHLALHQGRAVVLVDDGGAVNITGQNVHFVDLRPLLDDSNTTVMSASSVQGRATTYRARGAAIRGQYAYIATTWGLRVIDITEVMDENPATLLPASPPGALLLSGVDLDDLEVYGSYLVTSAANNGSVWALDVSAPLTPVIISSFPVNTNTFNMCTVDGTSRRQHPDVAVGGSRAWVTTPRALREVDLE